MLNFILPYVTANVLKHKAICIKHYDCTYFCLNYPSWKMHLNLPVSHGQKQ